MEGHVPVLLKESLHYLNAASGGKFIDGTAGDGGHTLGLLRASSGTEVLAIDWDGQAVRRLEEKLKDENLDKRCAVLQGNYADISKLADSNFRAVDGIILDLGFSSRQIDEPARGFSFQQSGPLDMRYDIGNKLTAEQVVNRYTETKLTEVIKKYGEEKFSKRIASEIVAFRKISPITDTAQVFRLITQALPGKFKHKAQDAARRVFQALRIEVNHELDNLRQALPQLLGILKPGGRMVIISFHSLEDRIVKQFFAQEAKDCVCPPEFPACVCSKTSRLRVLTRKPVQASEEEIKINPRSNSAKLRAAEKI